MSWLPPFHNRFDPNEPDEEDIALDQAIKRSYEIAIYSLLNEYYAEEAAFRVAQKSYDLWKPKKLRFSLKPNKPPLNRAFQIDLATYDAMERYKKRWIDNLSRALDPETVDVWFLEAIVEYVIAHQSIYVSVGIGSVLFTYDNTDTQIVLERLDLSLLETEAKHKDGEFRHKKQFILNYFKIKGGGKYKRCVIQFLTVPPTKHDNEVKRFEARANSSDSFEFVKDTLERLTPLEPDCPFPHEFYDGSFDIDQKDLEVYIKRHDRYKTTDGIDRVRRHVLLHPPCWMPIYAKLGMETPERKLNMPDYSSSSRIDLASRPPMNRSEMKKMSEEQQKRVKTRLDEEGFKRVKARVEEWELNRKKFPALSVMAVVNDEVCFEIPTDKPRVIPEAFTLDDGDSFIEMHGLDRQGQSILLKTFYIPWDRNEIGKGVLRHVFELNNGRKLVLLVKYEKDEFGDPISATVDVIYDPSWAYSFGRRLTTANAYPITWKGLAVAFAAGVAAAIATRKLVEALMNSKLSARVLDKSFSSKARWSLSAATVNAWRALCIIVIALFIPWASIMPAFISGRQTIQRAPARAGDNQSASASAPKSVNAAPETSTPPPDGVSNSNATNKEVGNSSRKVKSSLAPKIEKGASPSITPQRNFTNEQVSTEAKNSRDTNDRTEPLQPATYGSSSPERSGIVVGLTTDRATRTAANASTDTTASPERVSTAVSEAATPAVGINSSTSQGGAATVASNASPTWRAQEMIKIEKGQRIRLRPERVTDSQKVNLNDEFRSVVVAPVYVNGKEVIPVNSIITGKVSKVARASEEGELGIVDIKFNSLLLVDNPRPIKIKGELYDPLRNTKGVFVGNPRTGAEILSLPDRGKNRTPLFRAGASFAGCGIKRISTRKAADAVIRPQNEFEIRLKESVSLPLLRR